MADSAVARLRGILAATMPGNEIRALILDVAEEIAGQHVLGDDGRSCRAVALTEGADLLDSLPGDNDLTRDWNWRDAATIPASCAALLRSIAGDPAEQPVPYTLTEAAPLPMRLCWLDTSTYAHQARTCPVCGYETRWVGVSASGDADRAMEQHFGTHLREVHDA